MSSPSRIFRSLVQQGQRSKQPLQILGTVNAYSALLAQRAGTADFSFHPFIVSAASPADTECSGAKALYLSGSGVATASYGLPDLGITSLDNVIEDAKRITGFFFCSVFLLLALETAC